MLQLNGDINNLSTMSELFLTLWISLALLFFGFTINLILQRLIEAIKYIRPVRVSFWFGEIVWEDSNKLFKPGENTMPA